MKINYGNVVSVNLEKDGLYKELKFLIGGAEFFKEFLLNVVIHHDEIKIHQSILSDIVYITPSTLIDYERITEWLIKNAEVFE